MTNEERYKKYIEEHCKNCMNRETNLCDIRISVLNEFVNQIQNIQPTKKKVKVNIPFKCVWKLGDIFAYQLVSKKSEDFGVFNKYLIFQKVGESEVYPKKIIPIIRVSKRIYDDIPNIEEQAAIANILSLCDHEILLAKQKLNEFHQQKKGLMQVLLTGKKRVNI